MNEKPRKNSLIETLIVRQNAKADGSKLSPEAFRIMIAYLEQLEEKCNPSDAAMEQKRIVDKVNTILENNDVCLSDNTLMALKQMLPVYRSILNKLTQVWHAREKEKTLYVFEEFVDYTIIYSEKLENYGDFASPTAFPFPVIETAKQIPLLTENNYTEEMEKILEELSTLMDYLKAGLENHDKHMIMTANEILFRLVGQTDYIFKTFL